MDLPDIPYIQKQATNKKQYLSLLLLGDEQESMIDRYLERGELYVMYAAKASTAIGVAVVTDEGADICELKNLAILPTFQRKGYGSAFIRYLCHQYKEKYRTMQVGTGNSVQTTSFYRSCGFHASHVIRNFFTDNYDHPIIEEGQLLRDMIYFCKELY